MRDNFEKDAMFVLGQMEEESGDIIPLMSEEDEATFQENEVPENLAILPLRNTVLFPGVVIPITLGREKSIQLIRDSNTGKKLLGVVCQKDVEIDEPGFTDLHTVGTLAHIIRVLKMPDGSSTVILQGRKRIKIEEFSQEEPYMMARVSDFPELPVNKLEERFKALVSTIRENATTIINENGQLPAEAAIALKNIDSPSFLINFVSSNLNVEIKEKQDLLEISDYYERGERLVGSLLKEMQFVRIKNDIQSKVKEDLDKQQRDYFLNQQIRTIQDELGDNPVEQDSNELKTKAEKKKWPKRVAKTFAKEVERLGRMNPSGAEYTVQYNYLETLLDLPWDEMTQDKLDLKKAKRVLDNDHYGLEQVKDRILEHLAVLKLKKDLKAPILCLYGPPGVGKTSLGKSIAKSLGRKYVRMSLGGVRDEAEIRGHRKTYIGAMPGRILQNLKKAGVSNPVFVLDEIDKMARDGHGDPSSAMLEVLDPEQNSTFGDNYVEEEYDLSKVMFIATANNLSTIQPALLDRMEIIEVNGYTLEEKVEIAKRHLLPKLCEETGVKAEFIKWPKAVLETVVESYTSESGVRKLNQRLSKLVRNRAKEIAMEEEFDVTISKETLPKILGPAHEKDKYQGNEFAGVVTGLAWTSVGGVILYVETSLTPGKGKFTLTGNLGDVMKESSMLAFEYLKANCEYIGLKVDIFERYNVHIHVPEGATPKDGPSAGITMLTSLASAFTQRKVRSKLAMTGEITLRGKVLPVGGIKEKILAAKRANINTIILSDANEKDILDIDQKYIKGMEFLFVKDMKQVLDHALLKIKVNNARNLN
ncbi:MAG: ATP-dependent Lon protease [Sphingobacteriales bacterium]|jgi:ATP-dependent Lon protease